MAHQYPSTLKWLVVHINGLIRSSFPVSKLTGSVILSLILPSKMGLINSITTQLRPAHDHIDAVEVALEVNQATQAKDGERNDADVDIEMAQKPIHHTPLESGVAGVEAVQLSGGNMESISSSPAWQ